MVLTPPLALWSNENSVFMINVMGACKHEFNQLSPVVSKVSKD